MTLTQLTAGGLLLASIICITGCRERTISPNDETGITQNGKCMLSQLLPQTGKQQYWIFETYSADSLGVLPPTPTYIDSAVFRGEMQLYGGKMAIPQIIYRSSDGGATYSVYDTIHTAYADGKLYSSHILEDVRDVCNCSSQKWTTVADCSGGTILTRDTIIKGDPYPSVVNGQVVFTPIMTSSNVKVSPSRKTTFDVNGKEIETLIFQGDSFMDVALQGADTTIRFTNGKRYRNVSQSQLVYYTKGVGIVFDRLMTKFNDAIALNTKPYMRRLKKHVVL